MSRATLIDERPEEEAIEGTDELDTQDTIETPQEEQPQELEPESDIPEKYRGKSVEDLVQMHQELEKFSGKQSTEVGELRKVVDDFIQNQTQLAEQAPEPQIEDDVDFFVDPKAAVERAIENHPKIKEAEQLGQLQKKQTTMAQLQSQYPDMEDTLKDPAFAEWIKASRIRTQLFVQADQQYDYDSANELFSLWNERKSLADRTVSVEKQARKNAVKNASTGNARGTAEGSRRKVYRRSDIIKLMKTDPERYQSMSDEILKAYAEGRVK